MLRNVGLDPCGRWSRPTAGCGQDLAGVLAMLEACPSHALRLPGGVAPDRGWASIGAAGGGGLGFGLEEGGLSPTPASVLCGQVGLLK